MLVLLSKAWLALQQVCELEVYFQYATQFRSYFRANEQIKIDFLSQDLPFFSIDGPWIRLSRRWSNHHSIEEMSITFTYPQTKLINQSVETYKSFFTEF